MRIIIESNERADLLPMVDVLTEPAAIETMNGGSPSEALIQTIAGATPMLTAGVDAQADITAGPPPEWLVNAIQDAMPPSIQTVVGDSNAGAAPI